MYCAAYDCQDFVGQYRRRIQNAFESIERDEQDMDFENAWERDAMGDYLFQIKKALIELDNTLASLSFE